MYFFSVDLSTLNVISIVYMLHIFIFVHCLFRFRNGHAGNQKSAKCFDNWHPGYRKKYIGTRASKQAGVRLSGGIFVYKPTFFL